MTTGSGGTGAVGDVLSLTGNNHEGDAIFTLNGSQRYNINIRLWC